MNDETTGQAGCGCAVLIINTTIGGWCFGYVLEALLGKDVPWYADALAGLFLGQFMIPAAVISWILKLCGFEVPFFDG